MAFNISLDSDFEDYQDLEMNDIIIISEPKSSLDLTMLSIIFINIALFIIGSFIGLILGHRYELLNYNICILIYLVNLVLLIPTILPEAYIVLNILKVIAYILFVISITIKYTNIEPYLFGIIYFGVYIIIDMLILLIYLIKRRFFSNSNNS